jgi:vacuolar protein sorting-associated protein 41
MSFSLLTILEYVTKQNTYTTSLSEIDPKLPRQLYTRVLRKLLEEVESMRQSLNVDMTDGLVVEVEGYFLSTLIAWGTTTNLKEHVKLYEYQAKLDSCHDMLLHRTVESLRSRYEQSAVGYLDPASTGSVQTSVLDSELFASSNSEAIRDSLFRVEDVFAEFAQRISIIDYNHLGTEKNMQSILPTRESNSRVVIDAMAKVHIMNNSFEEALKCYLLLGCIHSVKSLEDIEDDALKFVNGSKQSVKNVGAYSFILCIIERYHLHQYLLDFNFLPEELNCSPICALIRLIGLDVACEFLMQNCTAPQQSISSDNTTVEERRGTLPLDLVADQLSGNPKLFHWYLHIVLILKPELYVKFPTTANPPSVIASLHKKHLDLYIRYAGPNRDSARALDGVESYLVAEKTTPLLSFIKVVLQLGTVGPIEVGKLLEIERRGGAGISGTFAIELAYIMENYGNQNEDDALLIIELFLKGAKSLMLAVSFAQRTKAHSSKLWEKLIEHCLLNSTLKKSGDGSFSGILFGSLLEAAALSGADLSHLVAQIPNGMQVEGLRPRLIAAVTDYRLKVQLHSKSNEIASVEKSLLSVESSQRNRKGMRSEQLSNTVMKSADVLAVTINGNTGDVNEDEAIEASTLRPRNRLNRYFHPIQIPILV